MRRRADLLQRCIGIAVCLLLTPLSLIAHQDPLGDVHPSVQVENGNFVVYFQDNTAPSAASDADEQAPAAVFRVVYSPAGDLLAPRHRRPGANLDALHRWREAEIARLGDETIQVAGLGKRDTEPPSYSVSRGGGTETRRLPWPGNRPEYVHNVAATNDSLLVAAASADKLYLHQFSRYDTSRVDSVLIGEPEFIYMFPVASNVVVVNGRFWIGWIRWNRATKRYEAVLSTWSREMPEPAHTVFDQPADGNSHMALAVIGDRLCLAYHCVTGDELPSRSRIVTIFHRAQHP
jgi:hypothetical protein